MSPHWGVDKKTLVLPYMAICDIHTYIHFCHVFIYGELTYDLWTRPKKMWSWDFFLKPSPLGMLDLEMVVNDEEKVCRFGDPERKTGCTQPVRFFCIPIM